MLVDIQYYKNREEGNKKEKKFKKVKNISEYAMSSFRYLCKII